MKLPYAWMTLAAIGGLLIAAPIEASAQGDPRDRNVPSLELNEADVRDALRIIFRFVGANYTVANDVQGTVTISLTNVPFETALRAVLNQVDATFRVEGGIYNIIKKEEQTAVDPGLGVGGNVPPQQVAQFPRRIRIRSADPALIIALISQDFSVDPFNLVPELSTAAGLANQGGGFGGGLGGGGGGGFGGGGFGGGGGLGGGGGFGGGGGGFGGGGGGFGGGGRGR